LGHVKSWNLKFYSSIFKAKDVLRNTSTHIQMKTFI
jgi:hypothetical protein